MFEKSENASPESGGAALIHLQTHPVVDLVVRKCDVVLVDRVPASIQSSSARTSDEVEDGGDECSPFLERDLCVIGARLGGDELLEVADGVVGTALHPHCGSH